jgi:hypothetical protein
MVVSCEELPLLSLVAAGKRRSFAFLPSDVCRLIVVSWEELPELSLSGVVRLGTLGPQEVPHTQAATRIMATIFLNGAFICFGIWGFEKV